MRSRRILRDFIIILFVIIALLVITEIVLRAVFPEKASKFQAYEFNNDYFISLKPNIEKIYVRGPENNKETIHWKTNKDSFRGNDLRENPQVRIMVYGDSNVQARFSRLENTFPYRLEKYLQQNGMDVEVVNAGIIGFGPDQSLIRFRKEADIYRPQLVIFHIFADNDFGDLIRNKLFALDSSGNLVETFDQKSIDRRLRGEGLVDYLSSLLIVRAARKAGRSLGDYFAKKDVIQCYISYAEQEFLVYKQPKPSYFSILADYYDVDIALFPNSESSITKVKLMNAILKEANLLAMSKGIKFLVLIQPSIVDLTTNFQISFKKLQEYPDYKRTNLTDAVKNICISNDIHMINLFDVFSRNDPGELFFKHGNNHWNDQGQDVAAKATASYITENLIPVDTNAPSEKK